VSFSGRLFSDLIALGLSLAYDWRNGMTILVDAKVCQVLYFCSSAKFAVNLVLIANGSPWR
jgi:hypothetical protein